MSFMKKLWKKNVERRKQQQQKQQLSDAQPQQQSPKTEMRESKGRRVAPTSPETSSASDGFKATVTKPGAPAEVWTESQVLDFLDSSDDTEGEPSWHPTADALVEMKDEEERDTQLASVHTSCRQGEDNRNNNAAQSTHHSPLGESHGDTRTLNNSVLSTTVVNGDQGKIDPNSTLQVTNADLSPHVEPTVVVVPNENVSDNLNDNAVSSLYPSELSSNVNYLQGPEVANKNSISSEQNSAERSEGHSSDSDASEEVLRNCSTPCTKLKLNTAIRPLTPPLGKSPGISQSKGKLKVKAKKNAKSKK